MPNNLEVVHAYRHLLRAGLRAVQFSKPARFVVRDQLREGFREKKTPAGGAGGFDAGRVGRTVLFLRAAARETELEHRILKNLVRVAGERRRARLPWPLLLTKEGAARSKEPDRIKPTAYRHYEMTVAMLNHSMGLCLR